MQRFKKRVGLLALHELSQKWANDAEVQLVDVGDYEESSDEDEDTGMV